MECDPSPPSSSTAPLEQYIQRVYDHIPKHASQTLRGRIFLDTGSAPQLDGSRTNRILVYVRSFNPPHQGHLQLLRHTFYHGSHLLNIIGAIIRPTSNDSVVKKCYRHNGGFIFGQDERCMLWKQDPNFPPWAWVCEGENNTIHGFFNRLKAVAAEDDFEIDYVLLRGPSGDDCKHPPSPDEFGCGASTLIMSDAARFAEYQRSNGYMRNFHGYSKWKGLRFNQYAMKKYTEWQTLCALKHHHAIDPRDAQHASDDYILLGNTVYPRMQEKSPFTGEGDTICTKRLLDHISKQASCDLENIIQCERHSNGDLYTIRFVKVDLSEGRTK